eukprot:3077761-Rhodomonas_salina.1
MQYIVNEAKKQGKSVAIAYLDWQGAFGSVSLSKLYLTMEMLGMNEVDINTILLAHTGAWVKVQTPFGESAQIDMTLGTPQGDCVSPNLFGLFINLCLRHLVEAGGGFKHKCGVQRNNTCFAEDVCLVTETPDQMQGLLDRVKEFCDWSGMELCTMKCKVSGWDFWLKRELQL